MRKVYLVTGARTPFAKAGTVLRDVHAAELGRFALSETLSKTGLSLQELGKIIDEVIIGNTGTPSDAVNISRVVALKAGLPKHISAYTVHRNCASALEALSQAFLKIGSGEADVIAAGGTESMSNMPLIYNRNSIKFFEAMSKAKSVGDKAKTFTKIPISDFLKPRIAIVEGLTDPFCGLNMGQTAEVLAKEFKISRNEQDLFALSSHQKTVKAQESGFFQGEIAPYAVPPKFTDVLTVDSGPRKDQSLEALGKLKPYFDRDFGSITVGNACPITDGACMTLIASEEGLKKLNMRPLALIKGYAFAGLDPERMGLGPVYATHKLFKKIGTQLSDYDIFEINEAFAAQVISCLKAFESDSWCRENLGSEGKMGHIDLNKLNMQGGAIAIGHPVGATGARIVLTTALQMKRYNKSMGLASLCIGGGQGGAMALEAV